MTNVFSAPSRSLSKMMGVAHGHLAGVSMSKLKRQQNSLVSLVCSFALLRSPRRVRLHMFVRFRA